MLRSEYYLLKRKIVVLKKQSIYVHAMDIIIPMKGQIDSVNVSVSAAIILFEAARQRIFFIK